MASDATVLSPDSLDDRGTLRPTEAFSAVLRERTKLVHREAERSGFIADLIRGRADRNGYAVFLRNLVPVYAALETALDAGRHAPLVTAFADPALRRLPALVDDLEAISGAGWRALPVAVEAEAYAAAIVCATSGPRIAAHAYARYLGDLSGGQILRPLLARTLGLGANQLRLYDFPDITDLDAPKRAMRGALDAIAPDSPEAEAIIAEAIAAFRHNIALSVALSPA